MEVPERRRSATFLIWFLQNVFHLEDDNAVSCICDEDNDKGIDAIYVDHLEEEIHIFQSKLKDNFPRDIGDRVLRDFAGIMTWFEDSESVERLYNSNINPELKSLIEENSLIDLISDYTIKYSFIINARKDQNTIEYLGANQDISLWCIDAIRESYHQIKTDPFVEGEHTFSNIDESNAIELNENNNNIIVVPILASELIKLNGIDDLTLFDSNVRFGLGSTRVNRSIVKTLKDKNEKDKFIMFHNGISIVCNELEYNGGNIKITDYSIVNGAQSTLTFYKNQELLDENVKVITKIIQTGEDATLSELITYYSNNQNSISMRDLRSNDTIQTRLNSQFEELDNNFGIKVVYIPKRGKPVQDQYFELNSDYAAQLITACYLKKPYDTHLKASMFDSKYNNIFNKNISASKLYLYFKIHAIVKNNIEKINLERIGTYGLAQFSIITILVKILESHDETVDLLNNPQDEYFSNMTKYDKLLLDIFDLVANVFNYFMEQKEKDEEFIYKNYFKNKDNVEELTAEVQTQFNASLAIAKTSYTEYYNKAFS